MITLIKMPSLCLLVEFLNKILLLEDDPILAKTIIRYLELYKYSIDWVKNGEEALDYSYENSYLIYLFDINVPCLNGVDLLSSLREYGDDTPTILISALIDIESVTKGFRAGADDYIKKPFDPEELVVRIKAKTKFEQKRVVFREFEIDKLNNSILHNNIELDLGSVQKKILISLINNYPNPVTKDNLFDFLEKPSDLALRVNISKLKRKLNIEIKNVRGIGYKII